MLSFFSLFTAEWYILPILLIGYLLCVIEMYVPGFGLPGISGIALLTFGVFAAKPTTMQTMVIVLILLALLAVTFAFVSRLLRNKRNPMVNAESVNGEKQHLNHVLLHTKGVTKTALRPVGIAIFGDEYIQVVSESGFIAAGTEVIVLREDPADDHTLIVREAK